MNKLITRVIGAALGLTMAIGVGVAVSSRDAIKAEADSTVTMAYSGSTTTNMTGNNDAAKVGLSATDWSVIGDKGSASNYPGLNKAGQIRLYYNASGSNTITVSSLNNWTITSITLSLGANNNNIVVKVGSNTVTGTNSVYTINSTSFELGNGYSANTQVYILSCVISYTTGASSTYSVTYDGNGATSGTVPTDNTAYISGATVTVKGNTGNLVKTGYVWSGWNTKNDGTGTNYVANNTFSISASTTLYAKWVADTLNSLSISGSMTNTTYKDGDSWNPAGFTVTANYQSGATPDVTSSVTWSYYVGGTVQAKANLGDTSVVVRATFGSKYVESSAQTVTVTQGATYDLSKIDGFSSWNNSYTNHSVSSSDIDSTLPSATMAFSITNKQGSGVGSAYPCIGAKTLSELECLTFTLSASGKKITSVDIVFVTRYTNTFPILYLHKGSGIATTALSTLTMSGEQASEHSLSISNLNDTVFTVGYNANQTSSNGAVGIKSISIGLANQAAFGTLDHISVTTLPNVIYHVGETYDPTGFVVTAYDGVDETTANFKDVTASVDTLLDNTYVFAENDVPGFDEEVEYTEGGNTVSTSFHIYVYALAEYELVTEELTDWSGQYLIVGTNHESNLVAMNGALDNPDQPDGYKVVTEASNSIETGQELEWTFSAVTGGYSIQGKSGKYIGSLTAANNGMLVSETALVNTIEYSDADAAATITGTNNYKLKIYNESNSSRFRYYASGTVRLYKKVESSAADTYAQLFLETLSTGTNNVCQYDESTQTVSTNLAQLKAAWKSLAGSYASDLTPTEKEDFRTGTASTASGASNIQHALALYDHIARAYGTQLQDSELTNFNFMNRTIQSSQMIRIGGAIMNENSASTLIIVVSMMGLAAVGGYFFLRKRKEQ